MGKNMYKDLIFTNHALKRMQERGIKQDQIWETYTDSGSEDYVKNGMSQKRKKFGDYEISVIFKRNTKKEVIVISCWMEPPLPGSKDAREKEWYNNYKKASFWGKIWLTLIHQLYL